MKNGIWYKDSWLMKGSDAYTIITEKKETWQEKLDLHMKEVNNRYKALMEKK